MAKEKIVVGNPSGNNDAIKNIIRNVEIDTSCLESPSDFRRDILSSIGPGMTVLDCGRSSRDYFERIAQKARALDTLDINDFGDYPDIIFDLCDKLAEPSLIGRYDVIICLGVLEHCYDPFRASENLLKMLKPRGVLFGYVPFMFRYHGPPDLHFQDFMRFSRDSIAYMFRDARSTKLFPIRGRFSTAMNFLVPFWKRRIEGSGINFLLDKVFSKRTNTLQCSGYNFVVHK